MFRDSSDCIEEYTTSATGFIKCIEDVSHTVTVRTYPNQKPWITGNISTELNCRVAAFKEQDSNPDAYKKSRFRQTIKQAKRQYRTRPTPALTLVGCGRACKQIQVTKGNTSDSCPVTRVVLTFVAMKCFERLVMAHINTIIPETLEPLQFAYRTNRSTDDPISI
jgi:hypothetical protein